MSKKLEEMTVSQILRTFDFPDHFVSDFRTWCEGQDRMPTERSTSSFWGIDPRGGAVSSQPILPPPTIGDDNGE